MADRINMTMMMHTMKMTGLWITQSFSNYDEVIIIYSKIYRRIMYLITFSVMLGRIGSAC